MNTQKTSNLNRRQFIQLGAASSGALLLAACGSPAAPPTAVPPTAVPAPTQSAALASLPDGVEVMAKDVLDFALSSSDWSGDFGSVTFRLHEGKVDGESIYYIRTDTSDSSYAEQEGLVYVPLLATANGQDIANTLYVFSDGAPAVMKFAPGNDSFASLFQIVNVTPPIGQTYDSAEAIESANGVTIEETSIFVNFPILKWPGGELSTDTDLAETLGSGQLFAPCDTEKMEVTMKLHKCYPGSRYILTDTSMPGMAPMMSINSAPLTQKLKDTGGTDEIWVFANGIAGPGVMGFQPAIFDNKAGEPAWSPFWDHYTVKWVDESKATLLKSSQEIRDLIASGDLEEFAGVPDTHPNGFVVNCPAPILAPNDFVA
ncbi:MAG: twin-arginine translocation signal domain-containing protein [Anaerolineae bacterium]